MHALSVCTRLCLIVKDIKSRAWIKTKYTRAKLEAKNSTSNEVVGHEHTVLMGANDEV